MGWTQKWARFGIEEPWLRLLTVRFESQLPWLRPVVESPRARELRLELIPAARRLLERAQVAPPIDDADIRRQMGQLSQQLDDFRREGVRDVGRINEVAAQLGVLHAQRRALEREVVERRAELVRQLEAELAELTAAVR